MGAEIANVSGRVLTVKVSGTLTQPELTSMQKAAAAIFAADGKWRILVLTENFAGWERGGSWDDFSFQSDHDAHIERMAIVGERQVGGTRPAVHGQRLAHILRSSISSRRRSRRRAPGSTPD